ncbi:PEPxxWA-CTERM sorting domain-containing protein [Pseudoduganella umbonata]|uniref:PEP-CTERM sorting domain-containing protein n=1 Tax=Pseudoduganella umbonata TaxID=864828 RepID=A0A4P8HHX4_9BURK|nr:PEPxxWA-CTERM sorting domain-containing protein [Pseudoduganella umbonata]MBB3221670.1 hypothetical protein [Pseudoduganella umbonata]QCP09103.1 PEP-CTERM sorting domain-containing protein [Pseudoduganella umbonata]
MKLTRVLCGAAAAATLLWANAANAELYQFTVSGDYTATWQLDSDQPSVYTPGRYVRYTLVAGSFPGSLWDIADVTFASNGMGIGDYATGFRLLTADGRQVYAESEDGFEFVPGTYALTESYASRLGRYTLTISAVPEPATYGMMLAGLGLVGVALRRRQVK